MALIKSPKAAFTNRTTCERNGTNERPSTPPCGYIANNPFVCFREMLSGNCRTLASRAKVGRTDEHIFSLTLSKFTLNDVGNGRFSQQWRAYLCGKPAARYSHEGHRGFVLQVRKNYIHRLEEQERPTICIRRIRGPTVCIAYVLSEVTS